ncbi:hypothetical protein [Duganella lactea]|uniref:hypothetical protein n=1 Tax=Duganella lactea TaxID=2692173 RepID=UPI0019288A05|nr:hypothetical protein [Duganella lactea]
MTDRRIFLHRAAASPRDRRPLIIDALGGIDNMNLPSSRREDVANDFGIDTRSMSDAKASGLTAFNMRAHYPVDLQRAEPVGRRRHGAHQPGPDAVRP